MKPMYYLLFLSLTYSSQTFSAEWIDKMMGRDIDKICQQIDKSADSDSNDSCNTIIPSSHPNSAELREACAVLLIHKFGNKKFDLKTECKSQMKLLGELGVDEEANMASEMIPTGSTPFLDQVVPVLLSPAMDKCKASNFEDYKCDTNDVVDVSVMNKIAEMLPTAQTSKLSPLSPEYTLEECNCLQLNLKTNYKFLGKSQNQIDRELAAEKNKINDLIFKTVSEKFINDYAANLEDTNYYLTNNVNALNNDHKKAWQLQCSDPEDFKESVDNVCGQNGVDPKTRDERIGKMLGIHGDFNSEPTLQGKFKKLTKDILTSSVDSTKTRYEYDTFRSGVVSTIPQIKLIDQLTTYIFEDPELATLLDQEIANGEKPGKAISKLLENKKMPAIQNLVKRITNENTDDNPTIKNLNVAAKSNIDNHLSEMVKNAYNVATSYYPGYKAIFRDTDLFNKLRAQNAGKKSLMKALENNPAILGDHFAKRCEKLKKTFAQTVCIKGNDYLSKTPPKQLNKFLSTTSNIINSELKDSLLCHAARGSKDEHIFTGLNFKNQNAANISDYHKNKSKDSDKKESGFDKYVSTLKKNDSKLSQYLERARNLGESRKNSAPEIASLVAKKEAINAPLPASTEKAQIASKASNVENHTDNLPMMGFSSPLNSYMAPAPDSTKLKSNKVSAKSSRSLLREFLADESNKEQVDNLLSRTSEEDLEKLVKLKQEIANDQTRLNELLQETERVKLSNMEKSLKSLENEIKATPKTAEADTQSEMLREAPTFFQGGSQSGTEASSKNKDSDKSYHSESSSFGRASTSEGRSTSNAARSPASRPDSGAQSKDSSRSGAIIIESSIVRSSDREVAREDLSKEVISYVNKSELDIQTLKSLKEKGLVLKFKVLKDGIAVEKEMMVDYSTLTPEAKKILDNKIALQERGQEYERLKRAHSFAALKLILGLKAKEQIN